MTTPEQIQDQIEHTRGSLSTDVDRLTEKVSPNKVVGRRVDDVKSKAAAWRDRVMGSGENGGLSAAGSSVSGTVSNMTDAASSAPHAVRQRTQGNPLAVGLIAFGLGWLVSSVAPASDPERRLAAQTEEKAKELAEPLKAQGQQMAEEMRQPLQESAQEIKATATDAAQETAGQAKQAATDVKEPMQR